MAELIPPEAQIAAVSRADVLVALHMPASTTVVTEATLPDNGELAANPVTQARLTEMGKTLGTDTRLTASTASCYAELVVSGIGYARSPVDPPVLAVRWIYRNWAGSKARVILGWRRQKLPDALRAQPMPDTAAGQLQQMYGDELAEWARKKVKA